MGPGATGLPERARGPSTQGILRISWDYPSYQAPEPESGTGTAVARPREALPRAEALRAIAGQDPRPLLIVRECKVCNKTDDALLARNGSNERTLILARWFQCVKLPVDVVEPDHPFNALFPTNDAEHLFVSAADGSSKLPLESDTSRTELWTAMERTLAHVYGIDAGKAVKQVLAGLDRVDQIERRITDTEARKGLLMEKTPVDRAKVKQLDDEIDRARKQVADTRKELEALFELPPKKAPEGLR